METSGSRKAGFLLRRQRTGIKYRVYVVAMDGSDLGKLALKQACFLSECRLFETELPCDCALPLL